MGVAGEAMTIVIPSRDIPVLIVVPVINPLRSGSRGTSNTPQHDIFEHVCF